jgi:hypothetical protein
LWSKIVFPDHRISEKHFYFLAALRTDRTISEAQAFEWHGINHGDLEELAAAEKIVLHTDWIRYCDSGTRGLDLPLISFSDQMAALPDWMQRHLVALAAVRRKIGASSVDWKLLALNAPSYRNNRFASDIIPDADWQSPTGRIVVEFDAGSHPLAVLAEKARAYDSMPRLRSQLWVVATPVRAANIASVLENTITDRSRWMLIVVQWWPVEGWG